MSVYVRWYSSILQGEVVENSEKGILSGMVAVRIQVQGMKATALYAPAHVYTSPKQISGNIPQISANSSKIEQKPREISRNESEISPELRQFIADHWDHQRNHLRIEALDEFYFLWKEEFRPFGFVEAKAPAKYGSKQCHNCKYWVHTNTLSSPDKPEWHCRDGFSPSKDCIHEAEYNDRCMEEHPNQRPADWKPTHQTIVSDERMAELRTQLKKSLKPVEAKQLSLFD